MLEHCQHIAALSGSAFKCNEALLPWLLWRTKIQSKLGIGRESIKARETNYQCYHSRLDSKQDRIRLDLFSYRRAVFVSSVTWVDYRSRASQVLISTTSNHIEHIYIIWKWSVHAADPPSSFRYVLSRKLRISFLFNQLVMAIHQK